MHRIVSCISKHYITASYYFIMISTSSTVCVITIINVHHPICDTYRQNVYLGKIPEKSPFSLQVIQGPDEHNVLQLLPGIVASSQGHYKIPKPHQCWLGISKDACYHVIPKLMVWLVSSFLSISMPKSGHFLETRWELLKEGSFPSPLLF